MYPVVTLKHNKEKSVLRKHPWIFSGAVQSVTPKPNDGDIVHVQAHNGNPLATGHWQYGSIAVRKLEFKYVTVNQQRWIEKIHNALQLRCNIGIVNECNNIFRLVFGEGDLLPGLVVDVYDHLAVIQAHSIGMHQAKHEIAQALINVMEDKLQHVYYKSLNTLPTNDNHLNTNQFLFGGDNLQLPLIAKENSLNFQIDPVNGQKTGFFIDQRDNRTLLQSYAKQRNVLNLFCYTGAFSVYAIRGNAKLVHSVDSSNNAVQLTQQNVNLKFPDANNHAAYCQDAYQFLHNAQNDLYDLIIIDPPAFAKHKNNLNNALQGYRKINNIAIEKVKTGGIIFTFSCSQIVTKDNFKNTIFSAAAQANRNVKILHQLSQSTDHPINIYHPEGDYLKGLVLQID
jgi:23S rRNA (cytosine1962-C5)-methyltransferase